MIEYKDLHWDSLEFIDHYLYQRVRDTLHNTDDNTTLLLNTLATWSTLIEWKTKGQLDETEFQALTPQRIPTWLLDNLNQRAVLKMEHTKAIRVHPSTFFEALVMLVNIAEAVGKLSYVMLNDAAAPREGVWLRVVYMPPEGKGYASKVAISDHLRDNRVLFDSMFIVADLFALNKTRFGLQNNTRTGHQAFAVLLPVTEAPPRIMETRPKPPTKLEKMQKLISENASALNLATTPAQFDKAIGVLAAIHAVLSTDKSDDTKLAEINQILDKSELDLGPSTTGQAEKVLITAYNLLEKKLPSNGEVSTSSTDDTLPSRSTTDQEETKVEVSQAAQTDKDETPSSEPPPATTEAKAEAVQADTPEIAEEKTTVSAESTDASASEEEKDEVPSEPAEDISKPNNENADAS